MMRFLHNKAPIRVRIQGSRLQPKCKEVESTNSGSSSEFETGAKEERDRQNSNSGFNSEFREGVPKRNMTEGENPGFNSEFEAGAKREARSGRGGCEQYEFKKTITNSICYMN